MFNRSTAQDLASTIDDDVDYNRVPVPGSSIQIY